MTEPALDFNSKMDRLIDFLSHQAQIEAARHEQMMTKLETQAQIEAERHELAMAELQEIRRVSEQNARASEAQRQSIERLAGSFGGLARTTTPLPRKVDLILETAQRAVQASETDAFSASRALEAVREIQEQMET